MGRPAEIKIPVPRSLEHFLINKTNGVGPVELYAGDIIEGDTELAVPAEPGLFLLDPGRSDLPVGKCPVRIPHHENDLVFVITMGKFSRGGSDLLCSLSARVVFCISHPFLRNERLFHACRHLPLMAGGPTGLFSRGLRGALLFLC